MRKRAVILGALILAAALPLAAQTWKGSVGRENGVTIVRNPKTPLYTAGWLRLKEELAFGGEALPAEAAFSNVYDLDVAADGRIYIADRKPPRIFIFDARGCFLKAFGKSGQGPGEFLNVLQLTVRSNGEELFVDGGNRGVIYDLEGAYIKNVKYPRNLLLVKSLRADAMIGAAMVHRDSESRYEIVSVPEEGGTLTVLAKSPFPDLGDFNPFAPRQAWTLLADGAVAEGYPERYEIKIHNPDGAIIRILTREYDPEDVTARDKETRPGYVPSDPASEIKFSEHFPAYQRIVADERGWLFVQTWNRLKSGKGYWVDVFDSQGRFVAQLDGLGTLYRARGGKIYAVDEDEEGYKIVKRYALEGER